MASRNRLINGPVGEEEFQIKRFSGVLYKAEIQGGVLFSDREQYEEAVKSGEWSTSPVKGVPIPVVDEKHDGCPYWVNDDCMVTDDLREDPPEEPKKEMTVDELAATLRKPETPIDPTTINRHLAIRNLAELRATGMPLGFDFPQGTTRRQMIKAIQEKQRELKREARR